MSGDRSSNLPSSDNSLHAVAWVVIHRLIDASMIVAIRCCQATFLRAWSRRRVLVSPPCVEPQLKGLQSLRVRGEEGRQTLARSVAGTASPSRWRPDRRRPPPLNAASTSSIDEK
jgi:hypothetical protein